ncbi:hypothetical protein LINPERPRIM_LOCUS9466 [Linum perenne]
MRDFPQSYLKGVILNSWISQFHLLRNRNWDVTIHHIFREANNAADFLANLGHEFVIGTHVIPCSDPKLLYWLSYDRFGVCLPRVINNTASPYLLTQKNRMSSQTLLHPPPVIHYLYDLKPIHPYVSAQISV